MSRSDQTSLLSLPLEAQKTICWILIVLAGAMAAGRVASVTQLFDPSLFRSAEERNSKRAWSTKKTGGGGDTEFQ